MLVTVKCEECGTVNDIMIFGAGVSTFRCKNIKCLATYVIDVNYSVTKLIGGLNRISMPDD